MKANETPHLSQIFSPYLLLFGAFPPRGLRDKPSKSADFYHTCYSLSGMAVSQYDVSGHNPKPGLFAVFLFINFFFLCLVDVCICFFSFVGFRAF